MELSRTPLSARRFGTHQLRKPRLGRASSARSRPQSFIICRSDKINKATNVENTNAASGKAQKLSSESRTPQEVVIQRGDTLYGLSRRYGVSMSEVAKKNGIKNPNLIYAGKTLTMAATPSAPPAAPAAFGWLGGLVLAAAAAYAVYKRVLQVFRRRAELQVREDLARRAQKQQQRRYWKQVLAGDRSAAQGEASTWERPKYDASNLVPYGSKRAQRAAELGTMFTMMHFWGKAKVHAAERSRVVTRSQN